MTATSESPLADRADRLKRLNEENFDVVVIGGGVAGVFAAWDASLRGLKTALVEQRDFAAGTSAHSLKILHGGIRYLQHLDLRRLRESCAERAAILRIAPHLTKPLPFAVPTRGSGMEARWPLALAFAALAALTADRNRHTRLPRQRIPNGRLISRRELARQLPDLIDAEHTGAGVFHDGQILNPPRLLWSVARSAADSGAVVANYCSAVTVTGETAVTGLDVRDELSGDVLHIRSRVVLNAAGPFALPLCRRQPALKDLPTVPFSRDMAFVLRRQFNLPMAVALQTKYKDPDAWFSRGNRHLFMVPWRPGLTLIGVNSRVYRDSPDELGVTEAEISNFLEEINMAHEGLGIRRGDIGVINAGLLPFGENKADDADLSFGKRSHILDHGRLGGPRGLVTGMTVRWTMGRKVAAQLVDLAEDHLGRPRSTCATGMRPVRGGDFDDHEALERSIASYPGMTGAGDAAARLARNYGSDWRAVLETGSDALRSLPDGTALTCEVRHAIRTEMALTLRDIVLRRTDVGAGGIPDADTIAACAAIARAELGWTEARTTREIELLNLSFPFASPATQDLNIN